MNHSLLEQLTKYNKTRIPMHMPGHKRNENLLNSHLPYGIDITEIDGFDNLHDMEGVLKETAHLAAQLYGARKSYPLINGTTCGILAAMHALCPRESHILMSRGSHKSVYNCVELLGLVPHYLTVDTDIHGIGGKISTKDVEDALCRFPEISLVVLTSPTYEGVVQNLAEIVATCHQKGVRVLVDSAHGAHLGFHEAFPESSISSGADIVVMSLHKTLPALTQTALLHLCTDSVSEETISESLALFETSSPSYVLMASIDFCLRFISEHKDALFDSYVKHLFAFYHKTSSLQKLAVLQYDDPSKIVISTHGANINGSQLAERLRKDFAIETEMASEQFVLAMSSLCDEAPTFEALADALHQIDAETEASPICKTAHALPLPKQNCTPSEAKTLSGEFTPLKNSAGRIALESVWAYPPGIPFIVSGEEIPSDFADFIFSAEQTGVAFKSSKKRMTEHVLLTAENDPKERNF